MTNIDNKINGNILTITIDLSKEFGPSKSGKTITVASTEGNIPIHNIGGKAVFLGVNVYKK